MCRQLTVVVLTALLTTALGAGLAAQEKNDKIANGGKADPLKKAVQQYEERIARLEELIRKASEEQKTLSETKLHRRLADQQTELRKRFTDLEHKFATVNGDKRKTTKELAVSRAKLDKANTQLHSTRDRAKKTESEIAGLRKLLTSEKAKRTKLAAAQHAAARLRKPGHIQQE